MSLDAERQRRLLHLGGLTASHLRDLAALAREARADGAAADAALDALARTLDEAAALREPTDDEIFARVLG